MSELFWFGVAILTCVLFAVFSSWIVCCLLWGLSFFVIVMVVADSLINRNCDVLPLSLEDLLNYKILMLKFCTNKPIWALLLRQVFFGRGERGHFAQKKSVTLHPQATDFQEKKILPKLNTYCKLL